MFRDVRKGMIQADFAIKSSWIMALDCIVLACIIGNHYGSFKAGLIGFFVVMFAFCITYIEGILMLLCCGIYTYWAFLLGNAMSGIEMGVILGIITLIFTVFMHVVVSNYMEDLSDW
jgi:hypothetical protein